MARKTKKSPDYIQSLIDARERLPLPKKATTRKILARVGITKPEAAPVPNELTGFSLGLAEQVLPKIDDGKLDPTLREHLEATIPTFLSKSTQLKAKIVEALSPEQKAKLEAGNVWDMEWTDLGTLGDVKLRAKGAKDIQLSAKAGNIQLSEPDTPYAPEGVEGMNVYFTPPDSDSDLVFSVKTTDTDSGSALKFSAGTFTSSTVNMGRLVNGYTAVNQAMDQIAMEAGVELGE